jgi:acyl carrier protein
MTNLEKYNKVFIDNFEVSESELFGLAYNSHETWDSVGHMALIADLEDLFEVMLDMEDIVDLSTYEKGKEILGKYDINI